VKNECVVHPTGKPLLDCLDFCPLCCSTRHSNSLAASWFPIRNPPPSYCSKAFFASYANALHRCWTGGHGRAAPPALSSFQRLCRLASPPKRDHLSEFFAPHPRGHTDSRQKRCMNCPPSSIVALAKIACICGSTTPIYRTAACVHKSTAEES